MRASVAPCHEEAPKSDPLPVMVPDQAHGLGDVAVVADHHRAVVGVEPAVVEQVYGQIDVRALLLGADHLRRALCAHLSGCRSVVDFIPRWTDDDSDDDSHDLEVFAGRIDAKVRFVLGKGDRGEREGSGSSGDRIAAMRSPVSCRFRYSITSTIDPSACMWARVTVPVMSPCSSRSTVPVRPSYGVMLMMVSVVTIPCLAWAATIIPAVS